MTTSKQEQCCYETHNRLTGLIVISSQRLENYANNFVLKKFNISISNVKILGLLQHLTNPSPSDLLQYLGGSKSNLTQRLDWLEKHDYVKRITNTKDKRSLKIQFTSSGKNKAKLITDILEKESLILEAKFSKEELEQNITFLKKLNQILSI